MIFELSTYKVAWSQASHASYNYSTRSELRVQRYRKRQRENEVREEEEGGRHYQRLQGGTKTVEAGEGLKMRKDRRKEKGCRDNTTEG